MAALRTDGGAAAAGLATAHSTSPVGHCFGSRGSFGIGDLSMSTFKLSGVAARGALVPGPGMDGVDWGTGAGDCVGAAGADGAAAGRPGTTALQDQPAAYQLAIPEVIRMPSADNAPE